MVRDVRAAFTDGARSVILQLPTGGGKTVIASTFMRDRSLAPGPTWFVCHRREILGQTSRTLAALGVAHGIIAPGKPRDPDAALQVCSVDSLRRMAATLPAPGLVIWDECHHIAARTWATLKAALGDARHLGLTATPARLDGKGLGEHFERIVCGPDTRSLIEGGHLSPYRAFGPSVPDLRGVKSKAGDFDRTQVAERMGGPVIVGCAVEHYKRLAPGSRAVVFAASVENSKAIVARFNAAGVPARHVDGSTPPAERDAAVEALRDGRTSVLSNVEVFTEGFDLPAVEAIILLRPTKSYALFRQMIGRGLRPAPGKARVVIQDHAGLISTHGMPDDDPEWTLDGADPRGKRTGGGDGPDEGLRLRVCPECSAIHEWAPECPECGHEYRANERAISEIYGSLSEIFIPIGSETQSSFAKRVNRDRTIVHKWVKRGLPINKFGYVATKEALDWVSNNITKKAYTKNIDIPNGFETISEFSKRSKLSTGNIHYYIKKGFPQRDDGLLEVEKCLKWLEYFKHNKYGNSLVFESQKKFGNRIGKSDVYVGKLIKDGLPTISNGSKIEIEPALEWVRIHKGITPKDPE